VRISTGSKQLDSILGGQVRDRGLQDTTADSVNSGFQSMSISEVSHKYCRFLTQFLLT